MFDYLYRMWIVMRYEDMTLMLSSMFATVFCTGIFFFVMAKLIGKVWKSDDPKRSRRSTKSYTKKNPSRVKTADLKEGEEGDQGDASAQDSNESSRRSGVAAEEWKLDRKEPPRNIPLAAADSLVQRGNRLIEEKNYKEGLVCFLSLLYSAVEGGSTNKGNLPSHLADCLRGAAVCYRNMGQPEAAVRFLQAERLMFEEMLASLQNKEGESGGKGSGGGAGAIVASLLGAKAATTDEPQGKEAIAMRRSRVLDGVADECMRHGNAKVALSYRVKAAAVRQKVTKAALDPNSEEFAKIAQAMHACEQQAKADASSGSTMPGGVSQEDQLRAVQNVIAREAANLSESGTAAPPPITPDMAERLAAAKQQDEASATATADAEDGEDEAPKSKSDGGKQKAKKASGKKGKR